MWRVADLHIVYMPQWRWVFGGNVRRILLQARVGTLYEGVRVELEAVVMLIKISKERASRDEYWLMLR